MENSEQKVKAREERRLRKAQEASVPGPYYSSFGNLPTFVVILSFVPWYLGFAFTLIGIPFAVISARRLLFVLRRDLTFEGEAKVRSKYDVVWLALALPLYPAFLLHGVFFVVLAYPFIMLLGTFFGSLAALGNALRTRRKPEKFKKSFKQVSAHLLRCVLWAYNPFWSPQANYLHEFDEPRELNLHWATFLSVFFVAKEVVLPLVNSATDISYTVTLLREGVSVALPGEPFLLRAGYTSIFSTIFGCLVAAVIAARFLILAYQYAPALGLRRFIIAFSGFKARDLTPEAAKFVGVGTSSASLDLPLELQDPATPPPPGAPPVEKSAVSLPPLPPLPPPPQGVDELGQAESQQSLSPSSSAAAAAAAGAGDSGTIRHLQRQQHKFDERLAIGLLRLLGTFAQDVIQLIVSCITIGFLSGISPTWLVNICISAASLALRWADYIVRAVFSRVFRGATRLAIKLFITSVFATLLAILILLAGLGVIPGSNFCNSPKVLSYSNMEAYNSCPQLAYPLFMVNNTDPGQISLSGIVDLPPTIIQNNPGLTSMLVRGSTAFAFPDSAPIELLVQNNSALTSVEIDVASLISTGTSMVSSITGNQVLSSLSFPNLTAFVEYDATAVVQTPQTGVVFEVSHNPELVTFTLPHLRSFMATATGSHYPVSITLLFRNNTALQTISLPALTTISQQAGVTVAIMLAGNPQLQHVTFGPGTVCTVQGGVFFWSVCDNPALGTLPCNAHVQSCS